MSDILVSPNDKIKTITLNKLIGLLERSGRDYHVEVVIHPKNQGHEFIPPQSIITDEQAQKIFQNLKASVGNIAI